MHMHGKKNIENIRQDLRRGVQADTVCLCWWRWLVIRGEDGKAGGSVDHVIDQVANRRRAKSRALLNKQRVPIKHTKMGTGKGEFWHPRHAYSRFLIKNNRFSPQKTIRSQTRCQRCASRLAKRHSDMVNMFSNQVLLGHLHLKLKILQKSNWNIHTRFDFN